MKELSITSNKLQGTVQVSLTGNSAFKFYAENRRSNVSWIHSIQHLNPIFLAIKDESKEFNRTIPYL